MAHRPSALLPDVLQSVRESVALLSTVHRIDVASLHGGNGASHSGDLFQRLGIYDQVKLKASIAKANEPVGDKLVRGEADIGFHQLSELIPVKGIQILGPLPSELQHITVFSGAIHSEAKEPDAGGALVAFLTTSAVGQSFRKHGLDPGRAANP